MPPHHARFDDLIAGRAVACPPPHRVLIAERAGEVAPVLAEVERATARGDWAYGYVSYEAASGLDPALPALATNEPLVWFGLCGRPVEVPVIRPTNPIKAGARLGEGAGASARPDARAGADARTEAWAETDAETRGRAETDAEAWAGTGVGAEAGAGAWAPAGEGWLPEWTEAEHAHAVDLVRKHIGAGDTYQCNLTSRLRTRFEGAPAALYAQLATRQNAALNAYLWAGNSIVASASPELFFEWAGDRVRTRPMKGTAPRGHSPGHDREAAARLRASPKEQAENLMIVDLLRNDLSKIAVTGSVEVPELFALERYPTVWQMTSEVAARLRAGHGLLDIFRALFPCGSVTGAPKRRSMEIIRELESGPRGLYCGAIGLVAPPGEPVRARFSVAIRTAVIDRTTQNAVYGAGGGITWDSRAASEWAELLTKARILHP